MRAPPLLGVLVNIAGRIGAVEERVRAAIADRGISATEDEILALFERIKVQTQSLPITYETALKATLDGIQQTGVLPEVE